MDTLTGLPNTVLVGALCVYVLAGLVKGTIGIGLPTAGISLTAQFTEPRTAIALAILPMLLTNAWQIWRSRQHTYRALPYWPLVVSMAISIALFAFVAPSVSIQWVTLMLGITVFIFAIVSLIKIVPKLPPQHNLSAQLTTGITSGVLGGITGVWAPPIVIYMSAMRADKATFVAVIGVFLFLGSLVLAISYSTVGLLSRGQAIASFILVIPAILGFALGERIRNRLDEELFKRLVLWFFLLMGLNLMRKAIW